MSDFISNPAPPASGRPAPRPDAPVLSVIPLGGVGEIGLNSTILEYGDDIVLIDCGLMFPDDEMLGVDIVIPDFAYLIENRHKLRAVVITHGHEDHTGALPYLLKEINVPVYGTLLTLGLIKEKLIEHELDQKVELIPVKPRDVVDIGPFKIEFIRVTHSIVDGVGLGITTPVGRIVHTGDFKIDPTPVDNQLMDLGLFSQYGMDGVLLLMSDSTNATVGGFTFSEKEVRRAFEDIFAKTKKRIIIASFASNIHRIQQAVDVAEMFGRKIILNGRSMVANARIAADLGYLKIPDGMWRRLEDLKDLKDEEVVIITTGSQGEPMSAMSRIAMNEHKQIKIRPGDTVIISAKIIPGNEKSINRIINHLFMRGADVKYEKTSEIHVSGHAEQGRAEADAQHDKAALLHPGARRVPPPDITRQFRQEGGHPGREYLHTQRRRRDGIRRGEREEGRFHRGGPGIHRRQGHRRRGRRGPARQDAARARRSRDMHNRP